MELDKLALRADPWATGPHCWMLDQVRLLPEPMPCRGYLGLWEIEEPLVLDALYKLIPEVVEAEDFDGYIRYLDVGGHKRSLQWGRLHAMTVLQPWATAIALGPKRVENRTWRRDLGPKGKWIGLHAGKTLYQGPETSEQIVRDWRISELWSAAPPLAEMPLGAMLGLMHVSRVERFPETP